ncbi:MAG: flagellar protein FliT [Dehalococcoidia bacterium]|nr:flagellar protein FliT [Dehalococcoidia bacterium]
MTQSPSALDIVRRLLALTEEQAVAVAAGDWPRFHALLDERQLVISTPELATQIVSGGSDERDQAMTMLARIEELDGAHRDALERERSLLRQELPGLEAGRRAAAAYRDRGVSSAYVDASS